MMETNTIHQGDAWQLAKTLPPNSISIICCSPPYFGLRDYSTGQWEGGDAECEHVGEVARTVSGGPGKQYTNAGSNRVFSGDCGKCGARRIDQQAGLEATPELFIAKLVTLFRDLRTALHPTGQCFINISDTRSDDRQWLGIPHRLVFALQADGWRYEDEIIWSKLNPMPGSQTNRFTRSHEFVFMLNKSRDAYFDAEAVREAHSREWGKDNRPVGGRKHRVIEGDPMARNGSGQYDRDWENGDYAAKQHAAGRMRRTVWSIATQPLAMPHFAAYPEALVRPMIEAGSSAAGVCGDCGAPWQRETNSHIEHTQKTHNAPKYDPNGQFGNMAANRHRDGHLPGHKVTETTGWAASCTCSAGPPIPAIVCDPFMGAGTTAVVAVSLGRRYVGFELNESYVRMARQRIGATQPMLTGMVTT